MGEKNEAPGDSAGHDKDMGKEVMKSPWMHVERWKNSRKSEISQYTRQVNGTENAEKS